MKKHLIIACALAGLFLFGFTLIQHFEEEDDADFSIAIIPDTQFYTAEEHCGKKEMFYAQTDWILRKREKENIKYVIHLGDISNHGDADSVAWKYAAKAMYALEMPLPAVCNGLRDRFGRPVDSQHAIYWKAFDNFTHSPSRTAANFQHFKAFL